MIKIRTLIGRKLNHVNGILRRQIELDRYLHTLEDVQLEYLYYNAPLNPIDYIAKRYILYPLHTTRNINEKNVVNHLTFQYLGDLGHFLKASKTVITCHDIFTFLERSNWRNPFPIQKYASNGLKKCKYIISISDYTKKELNLKLKIPPDKIVVIKNGVNSEIFTPLEENEIARSTPIYPDFHKILHVGTEEFRKDFPTLLKAFYLVKKKITNVKLIRIGRPKHNSLLNKLDLTNDVIYYSGISDERLRDIYNMCEILVFPSIYEGWGAPGLESASCGTPVICSDIPIFREVYDEFPLYFQPGNYSELAKLIIELINDEDKKIELSKKGLDTVKRYSWRKSSKKYLNLMKFIIEDS
jgi:glycosyltransferase involved in cell wall biosynthesis